MVAGLLITAIAGIIFWLIFFKFKWIRPTYGWGLFVLFFIAHLVLIFLVGMRFVAPYTTDAKVIQHTIQLTPRLPEPTLVTAVLVEPNVPIKKGQPLFQFDRRPYEDKVRQLEATLAAARQNVFVLKAEQVRLELLSLKHSHLVDVEEAVVIVRTVSGKVRMHHTTHFTAPGALGGGWAS